MRVYFITLALCAVGICRQYGRLQASSAHLRRLELNKYGGNRPVWCCVSIERGFVLPLLALSGHRRCSRQCPVHGTTTGGLSLPIGGLIMRAGSRADPGAEASSAPQIEVAPACQPRDVLGF